MNTNRDTLLTDIIERELAMFTSARNEGGRAACQDRPDTFRLMRRMAHEFHGEAFLLAYRDHLAAAQEAGRNLMVEKYARMDERLPPLSDSPLLDEIADAEAHYVELATAVYPMIFRAEGWKGFRHYLRCELETYSPACLELYAWEMREAAAAQRNPVLERYEWLARHIGKTHLANLAASRPPAQPTPHPGELAKEGRS